jgi:hypothetical protein
VARWATLRRRRSEGDIRRGDGARGCPNDMTSDAESPCTQQNHGHFPTERSIVL